MNRHLDTHVQEFFRKEREEIKLNPPQEKIQYVVRGDLHGRIEKALEYEEAVRAKSFSGVFDLGDLGAPFLNPEHWLRANQNGRKTMNTMVENALQHPDKTNEFMKEVVESIHVMAAHAQRMRDTTFYRGIAGNARAGWLAVVDALAEVPSIPYDETHAAFCGAFDSLELITDAGVEFYRNGKLVPQGEHRETDTAVLYMPWLAPPETVEQATGVLNDVQPSRIVVMSHDYLTRKSFPEDQRDNMRPHETEEQTILMLDGISQLSGNVEAYFGHIGWHYPRWEVEMEYRGKEIKVTHIDECSGSPDNLTL